MAEQSHKSWAVNQLVSENFSICVTCQSSFKLFFFLVCVCGGGGLLKVLGKTERRGKFGKISLMI